MSQLSLVLLGAFVASFKHDGPHADPESEISLPTDKTRALLAYVALTPDVPLRRETLATLLWSEQGEKKARQNLRKTFARLRQSLDDQVSGFSDRLFSATRHTIEFHSAQCQNDVQTARRELERARTHDHGALWRCASCLEGLERATALLQQGELLAGLSLPDAGAFEEWLRAEREVLHRQLMSGLELLVAAYEEQGAYDRARRFARLQLEQEPWREEAHRRLMRLFALQGRRTEAIAQYKTCQEILRREFDLAPSAETEALLNEVMDGALLRQIPTMPLHATPHLPRLMHPLVGRKSDLKAISHQLLDEHCRLLTLTGPGGIGKTSLALALGRELQATGAPIIGVVAFIALDGLESADLLPATVARALGLTLDKRHAVAVQVERYLRDKSVLLILDNFELPWAESSWLRALSSAAPRVKFLVTARAPLNWQEEWRYPLQGLSYPQKGEHGERFEAVQLFIQAARRARPGFRYTVANGPSVACICRQVQGWPLALEMAAAWVRMMSCEAICKQITQSSELLSSAVHDVPQRQRSIKTIFEHTWATLSVDEKTALVRLTVFRGDFSRDAAQTISTVPAPLILQLIDKSLVHYNEEEDRYQLHPLLRQFAVEKAQATPDVLEETKERHCHFYLNWLAKQDARRQGADGSLARHVVEIHGDNLRQAWLWATRRGGLDLLIDNVGRLARYYRAAGLPQEGAALLRQTLQRLADKGREEPLALRAHILYQLAQLLSYMGQYGEAVRVAEEARELATAADDPSLVAHVVIAQAHMWREQGQYEQALHILEQALAFSRAHEDADGVARVLHAQGNTYWSVGAYEEAMHCYETGREIARELGNTATEELLTGNMGVVYWRLGKHREALRHYEVALEGRRRSGDASSVAIWMGNMGLVYIDLHDDERALAYLNEALEILKRSGRPFYKIGYLLGKVELYLRQGNVTEALRLHRQAVDIAQQIGNRAYLLECDLWAARLYRAQGRAADAVHLLRLLLVREFRPHMASIIFDELSAALAAGGSERPSSAGAGLLEA